MRQKKVKFNKTNITVKVGKKAKVTLKNAAKKAKVTWKISNKKVIKLTKKSKKYAVVKGVKKGTTTLKATYKKGKVKKILKCKVKVEKDAAKTTASVAPGTSAPTQPATPATPATSATPTQSAAAPTQSAAASTEMPTTVPTTAPSLIKVAPKVDSKEAYSYFNDYTLGYDTKEEKVVAYKNGAQMSLEEAGAKVYDNFGDNVFEQQTASNNWDTPAIKLTAPLQYTTADGTVHDIDSMLTNFDFIADPTALDNSDVDGKLYVYGTNEGFDYADGKLAANSYSNHSLSILSTSDMVNWTDEGLMDNGNLTNLPDSALAKNKVTNKWTTKAWAPSALKIDGDGDGEDEYYVFYTDGGGVGYVRGDSPVGPWYDDLGKKLFTSQSEGCSGVKWCFDPAVLADDNAYVYFGGGNDEEKYVQTGRVCKLKFEKGTGKVSSDGVPQILDTFCFFEDGEINQIDGKYIYSYCTNWDVKKDTPYVGAVQIAAYISSDPMNIAFFPDKVGQTKYTDDKGVAHNFLGTILDNPSKLYGETYNNHHHMQNFKGHNYIFYHSTALSNTLYRDSKQYRNLHVNEIDIDMDKETIDIKPSYQGAKQLENFNPYTNQDGSVRYVNATTASKSAGVKSLRDDRTVMQSYNGSPMVLDQINTGDWTKISGVDFGANGLKSISAEIAAANDEGQIEVYLDDPTVPANRIARIGLLDTKKLYAFSTADIEKEVTGVHDVYFVFRGTGYNVASWVFSEKDTPELPDLSARPTVAPIPTMNPNLVTGWNADKTEYAIPITEENVEAEGGASAEVDMYNGQASLTYNGQYPGVWFNMPEELTDTKFSSIEIKYDRLGAEDKFGCASRYKDAQDKDVEIQWAGTDAPFNPLEHSKVIELNKEKELYRFKIFGDGADEAGFIIKAVILKR